MDAKDAHWVPQRDTPSKYHETKISPGKTTSINKYAGSSNVTRLTHQERIQINKRSRDHRDSRRPRQVQEQAQAWLGQSGGVDFEIASRDLEGATCPAHAIADTKARDGRSYPLGHWGLDPITRPVPGNTADPFDTSCIPVNSSVIRLLRYYKEIYYPSIWNAVYAALDGRVNKGTIVRCSPEQVILQCMEDWSRMNTLLAGVGCHLSNKHGIGSVVNSSQLLQRGTASLREEFRSKVSNVDCDILLDALHLYIATTALRFQDNAQAHLAGIKAIMERILGQGAYISPSLAAMLALIAPQLSYQLLSQHPAEAVEHSIARPRLLSDTSFEEVPALPSGRRP